MAESCTLLIHFDKGTPAVANEIKEALEGNNVFAKVEAMKKAIMLLLNGETILSLISTIGQVVRSDDFNFTIRKLTLLYLEIMIGKAVSRGRVLTEVFTMTCHVLQSNLHYPNVYIQGLSLRFLGRLNNPHMIYDIIYIATSLFSLVLIKLRHSHPYVRRNAILAVTTFCKLLPRERFLVDTPWTIKKVLSTEQDPSVKRNALLMLSTCAQDIAVNYLITHFDQILDWGEQLQMVVLELIRKVCRTNEHEKGKYFKIIRSLLTAPSTVVIYECAGTFVSLSSAPTAIRAAVDTYCKLLQSQSDKNVKLIVLDRLQELKTSHKVIMIEMIMDVLRALSSANLLNRGETLDIVLELITPWNVVEVIYLLKEEVVKTQNAEHEKIGDYRQMLGQVIDICTIKYSKVASTWTVPVVDYQLEDFLSDANVASPKEFVLFVRKVLETDRGLWVSIISRLLDTFDKNRCARSCSRALWIIGEYCRSLSEVESGIATIKQCLGELPFYTTIEEGDGQEAPKGEQLASATTVSSRRPMVLADGTYATQSAALETAMSPRALVQGSLSTQGNLRSLLLSGNFLLGAVVACTLAKLVLRLEEVQPSQTEVNKAITQALLYMFSTIQLGQSPVLPHPIDNDAYDIIVLCIRLLCNTGNETRKIWPHACRESFLNKLADNAFLLTEERKAKAQISHSQLDVLIDLYLWKRRKGMEDEDLNNVYVNNLIDRILQLTGFNDPVYAEVHITVHWFDVVLDVTVINRTKETLQNLCLELATMGDLELVECPQNYTLAPESSKQIRANIKASSTEIGVVFGNIVYDTSNVLERNVVFLNDVLIDITDNTCPATCADVAFRNVTPQSVWGNKAVNHQPPLYSDVKGDVDYSDAVLMEVDRSELTDQSYYFLLNFWLKCKSLSALRLFTHPGYQVVGPGSLESIEGKDLEHNSSFLDVARSAIEQYNAVAKYSKLTLDQLIKVNHAYWCGLSHYLTFFATEEDSGVARIYQAALRDNRLGLLRDFDNDKILAILSIKGGEADAKKAGLL